jgi:EpsI family protein
MNGSGKKGITAALVLLIFGGFGTYLQQHRAVPDRAPNFGAIPMETSTYFGTEHRFDDSTYMILKADTSTLRMYHTTGGEDVFWLFMAYFSSQKYGSQIHSPKHCLPGGGFKIVTIEPYKVTLTDGRTILVNRLLIANEQEKELMFYWFETRTGVISNEYGLKFDLMKNSIMLKPTDAAICRVTMPLRIDADFEAATGRLVEFIRQFYPPMKTALPFGT